MQTKSTFTGAGWDFETVWEISGGQYPALQPLVTDADAVADAKAALEIGYGSGDSETSVTQDLTLPISGASGTTITWSSSDLAVIGVDGNVTPPSFTAGDQTVTLTATITKGTATDTKTFTVTVKALPESDAEAVANAKAALEIGYGSGDSETSVTQDLTLPISGASGTTITWASSDLAVIGEDGKVTLPSSTTGDQTVTLTATITKGSETDTKTFTVTVKALPESDAEAVANAKAALEIGYGSGDSETSVTQDLTLPTAGASDTTITWASSDLAVIGEDGNVTPPSFTAGDQTVTLTATIKKGSETETKTFTVTVKALPESDAEAVANAKAALEIGYGSGDSETSVTQDLTLPTAGASDTTITWASSDLAVIGEDGNVTPPSFTTGDQTVTLTATITKGSETDTKTFTVTVKALPESDAEAVANAKAALEIGYGSGDSETSVTQDLTLPTAGASDTTITWASSDPAVIGEDGNVTPPSFTAGDQTVTLTATITKGTATDTKTFTVTVKALPESDAEAVANAKAALEIGYGSGDSETSVTQDLTLPTAGASDTTITWASSDLAVIGEDGNVTPPSFTAGDQTVTLTATITKGTATDTKTFTVTVKALPESDAEAVANAKAALEIGYGSGDSETSVTQDLTLPTAGASDTTITWASSDLAVIGEDGNVTPPSFTTGDQTVTLTATITKGSETDTKTFTVTVKALPESDAEAVANAKAALEIGYGSGDSETSVTQDLTLPTAGASDTTITWASSDPAVIGEDGNVTPPSFTTGDQTVTLTATITKGSETETKTFTVTVVAIETAPPTTIPVTGLTLDKPTLTLTAGGATAALKATVAPSNATNKNVTWSSSNPSVATVAYGVVTPVAAGTATITAMTADGGFTAFSEVTVSNPSPVITTPTPVTSPEPATNEIEVLVNGKVGNAGTVTTSTLNDQSVTTVAADPDKLDKMLAAEGENAVVIIPVNTGTDAVVVELNGQMVKNMEQKQAVVEIRTQQGTYTLPARQINIDSISSQLGQTVNLQDIKIHIQIATPTADAVKLVEDTASQGGFSLVVPPVEFIVQGTYGGQTVEISRFDAYVERTINIPDGVDSNRITTGVVTDPDGTVRHVPTKIEMIDGKYYAVINSLTNSLYSVIWNPVEFSDVENHWAKVAANDMGSRMVVDGTGSGLFSPNRDITRAEFAAILVRGLGLKLDNETSAFSDVKAADWYASAVATAYEYHLITGFEDGTFRPADKITREQALTMIAKAMQLTGLQDKLSSPASEIALGAYADADEIGDWAKSGIADSLQAGVSTGRSASELAPKAFITRAEVATLMQRLLQKSELI
ncbi:immunoglobulin-like domain-containing protein [Cohnella algarum]|uniref:immunoglobulin-like domain-containing protein n=1 Tax=Cohnella algarum TaxID=2044859 RepID=UPI001F073F9F|nr:immunoglobulin-like domain-containing protein [Cohnella algarum]